MIMFNYFFDLPAHHPGHCVGLPSQIVKVKIRFTTHILFMFFNLKTVKYSQGINVRPFILHKFSVI
jgi:hypothetical protein